MADAEIGRVTKPLDEKVWRAWVENNRMRDERFETNVRKWAGVIGACLVGVMFYWLARH